jgi:hypothetical protein
MRELLLVINVFHAVGLTLKKRYVTDLLCLYKTIIRPVVFYGAESCILTNNMEKALMTEEQKILRKIYG